MLDKLIQEELAGTFSSPLLEVNPVNCRKSPLLTKKRCKNICNKLVLLNEHLLRNCVPLLLPTKWSPSQSHPKPENSNFKR